MARYGIADLIGDVFNNKVFYGAACGNFTLVASAKTNIVGYIKSKTNGEIRVSAPLKYIYKFTPNNYEGENKKCTIFFTNGDMTPFMDDLDGKLKLIFSNTVWKCIVLSDIRNLIADDKITSGYNLKMMIFINDHPLMPNEWGDTDNTGQVVNNVEITDPRTINFVCTKYNNKQPKGE